MEKEKNLEEENRKITFKQLGFRSANNTNSNPESIERALDTVYEHFLTEQRLDEAGLAAKIEQLKAEKNQDERKKNELKSEISSKKQAKENKENEIDELEIEKISLKNDANKPEGDTIPFVIGSFITILLTLYLFVFYSSSGYSAFYGVKQGSLGFINPNVFIDAQEKGAGVIALIILFPVIFLGLGFLIHDALEKNSQYEEEGKPKKYFSIIALLGITLIADAFIGYKIAEGVHNNDFNAGLTNKLWQFEMIYKDINFYLVLILGFVVYVIWGFLLHFVLSHPYLKSESERIKLLRNNLNRKINEKKEELSKVNESIFKLEGNLESTIQNIMQKEEDIIGYETGVIPINVPLLKRYIGEFMEGYQNFTFSNLGNSEETTMLVNKILSIQKNWVKIKLETLRANKKSNNSLEN